MGRYKHEFESRARILAEFRRSRDHGIVLSDGRYDAFVVWADHRDGDVVIELTITTGEHKGDVVNLVANHLRVRDPIELVGLPCTLVVEAGEPRIEE